MDVSSGVVMMILLVAGALAGFLMHRSDFCMAGAFRDVFLFNSYKLVRPIVLLVALSAILFEISRLAGLLPYYPFPWFSPPGGGNIIGGMIFGVGMVMAGGCVVGVLYKFGGGNLLAGIAILGLLTGSALYAEIHPWWISFSKRFVFHSDAVTLPQLLSVPPTVTALLITLASVYLCVRWYRAGYWKIGSSAEGFIPYWMTAFGLAVLSLVVVFATGLPMGITTSYAKTAALFESWLVPQHIAKVSFFVAQPIHYVLPFDEILRSGGAGPHFDVVAVVQVPLIVGIILGAAVSALLLGELNPVWRVPKSQVSMVFAGGVIMAFGSRMTPGCNIWHIMGGLPLLTMQSLLFVVGLLPGAWLGSKILKWVLMKDSVKVNNGLVRT